MKTKSVKILINIGSLDAERLRLGHEKQFLEGDVVSLDEVAADKLIAEGKAREHDAASQKEDAERAARQHEAAVQAAMPAAERDLVAEEAKKEAAKRAAKPATPSTISSNPHDPIRKTS